MPVLNPLIRFRRDFYKISTFPPFSFRFFLIHSFAFAESFLPPPSFFVALRKPSFGFINALLCRFLCSIESLLQILFRSFPFKIEI